MGQEQNSNQPATAESNQKKRHYREIGGPVQADNAQQGNQKSEGRSGGNRPPRNSQRQPAGVQSQSSGGSGQRQRRPKNRRPASQQAVKQGPVERTDSGRQNEKKPVNAIKAANTPEQRNEDSRKQPRQGKFPRQDQQRTEQRADQQRTDQQRQDQQSRSSGQKNRQPARWEKKVRTEENVDDIRRDIERIEKEIWLEIASIHTIKLDF